MRLNKTRYACICNFLIWLIPLGSRWGGGVREGERDVIMVIFVLLHIMFCARTIFPLGAPFKASKVSSPLKQLGAVWFCPIVGHLMFGILRRLFINNYLEPVNGVSDILCL